MLSLSHQLANGRTHDGKHLEGQDMEEDEGKTSNDEEDLNVELDEATASLPGEAAPRIQEADDASATENSGNDLAAESAVKRNNEVLVLGENRRLDADECDDGGKAEEERAHDADDEDGNNANDEGCPLGAVILTDVLLVELVQAHEHANATDDVQADKGHGSFDGSRNGESLPVLLGGDALAERLVVGHADDLVCPGRVEVGERGAGQGSDENGGRTKARQDGLEDLGDGGEEEGIEEVDLDASEAGVAAGVANNVLDGAAYGRSDGLLVDEGDGGSGLEQILLLCLVAGFMGGGGDGDGCDRSLDHAESGHDFLERVVDLKTCHVRHATSGRVSRDGRTYQAYKHSTLR